MIFVERISVIFLICIIPFYVLESKDTAISDPPKDTFGCLGGMSNFTCSSNRSNVLGIWWTIDGNALNDLIKEERGIFVKTFISTENANSTLTIAGLPINDGARIACSVTVSPSFLIETKSAKFNVFTISSVQDLTISETQSTEGNELVTVTWNKPSCLPANYTCTYLVTVYNGTEVIHTTNTTDEQYSVVVSPCNNYTFSVMAFDADHPQSKSLESTVEKVIPEKDFFLDKYDSHTTFHNKTSASLNVTFNITNATCQMFLVQRIESQYPPDIDFQNENWAIDVSHLIDRVTGIGQYSIGPLTERFTGELFLSTEKNVNETSMVEISTFNVQKLDVQQLNGRVVITCTFAEGSLADGCAVKFNSILTVNMTKSNDSNTAVHNMTIGDGVYDISAYDIVDRERSDFVAFELDKITFSSVLITEITSYSTGSQILTTTSTQASELYSTTTAQASEVYSTTTASPSNILTSERSDTKFHVVAALALVIVIVLIVGCVMFAVKKYHTKSMEVNVLQEAMFLQKPVAQLSVYTELVSLSVPVTTEHHDEQDDPYFIHLREFLNQSDHSSAPVTSSTNSSDTCSLQLAHLHDTFERSNPGDTPIITNSASQQDTLFAGYSNPLNTTNGSNVSAYSQYAEIDFIEPQPHPPLRHDTPPLYNSGDTANHNETTQQGDKGDHVYMMPHSTKECPIVDENCKSGSTSGSTHMHCVSKTSINSTSNNDGSVYQHHVGDSPTSIDGSKLPTGFKDSCDSESDIPICSNDIKPNEACKYDHAYPLPRTHKQGVMVGTRGVVACPQEFSHPGGTTEFLSTDQGECVGSLNGNTNISEQARYLQINGEKTSDTSDTPSNDLEEMPVDDDYNIGSKQAKESADSGIEKFERVHTSNVVPQEVPVHVSSEDKTDDSLAYRTESKEEFSLNMEPSSAGNDTTKPVFKGASPDNEDSALPTCTLTETDTEEISGSKKQDCDKIGENSGNHSTSVFVLK